MTKIMFGKAREDATNKRAVGQDLAKVLPDDSRAWYKQSYLIRLNVLILSAAFLSAANGCVALGLSRSAYGRLTNTTCGATL